MRSAIACCFAFASACATTPAPPAAPLPPLPRSSIAAVLQHRGELNLTDDQVRRLQDRDDTLDRENAAIREDLAHFKPGTQGSGDSTPSGDSTEFSGSGGGSLSRGGGRHRRRGSAPPTPATAAQQKIDDNDTNAYLDAENILDEAQRPIAREIASKYRQELYERRRKSGPR